MLIVEDYRWVNNRQLFLKDERNSIIRCNSNYLKRHALPGIFLSKIPLLNVDRKHFDEVAHEHI